jgi:hypothetical protein
MPASLRIEKHKTSVCIELRVAAAGADGAVHGHVSQRLATAISQGFKVSPARLTASFPAACAAGADCRTIGVCESSTDVKESRPTGGWPGSSVRGARPLFSPRGRPFAGPPPGRTHRPGTATAGQAKGTYPRQFEPNRRWRHPPYAPAGQAGAVKQNCFLGGQRAC